MGLFLGFKGQASVTKRAQLDPRGLPQVLPTMDFSEELSFLNSEYCCEPSIPYGSCLMA